MPVLAAVTRRRWLPGLVLLALAGAFSYSWRSHVLIALLLFAPLLDRAWRPPPQPFAPRHWAAWAALLVPCAVLLWLRPDAAPFFLNTLMFAAIPEEWYFRAYLMPQLGRGWRANALASLAFALLHALTRGWETAFLVFWPSLFYGYLYQRTNDLILVMLAHAASNLVYFLYLYVYFE